MIRFMLQLAQGLLCLSTLASAAAVHIQDTQVEARNSSSPSCRCFPGDSCWPTQSEWDAFNQTLGGKLVKTIPIASVCHDDQFEAYDAAACANLQDRWSLTETHYTSSSSIMAEFFANQSCEAFLPKSAQCIIGTYVQYAVNASEACDYQRTIAFTTQHNIRLTIRNTGHDYIGKSTGAGAVAIWTHHMKDMEVMDYKSSGYTGKALKMGAGVQVFEAFQYAHDRGLAVVGGNCQTVGISGGYSQGGGHGALASKFGMAADQVLEWEVVTGTGELLTASPTQNSDLYWALAGGGGGTYGAVVSMTSRAHPDLKTSAANLTFTNAGVTQDQFYDVVGTFITNLLPMLDAGAAIVWWVTSDSFAMTPATGPGLTAAQLDKMFAPVFNKLKSYNISYVYQSDDFPTYLASNLAYDAPYNITDLNLAGRLIPRSLAQNNLTELVAALRSINSYGSIVSGISIDASRKPGIPANAVTPVWRDAVFDAVIGLPYTYTNRSQNVVDQNIVTDVLMPKLESLTPGGGSYLNEADFQQPNFQQAFYGGNYAKLETIKDKYDPHQIFYALTAVGSERWEQESDGRLCRVA